MSQQILASKTKSVLLGFFLNKPDRYYSEPEIRKQVSGRNLAEDLSFLTKHDFILKQERKRLAFYALNKKAFLEPGLRAELAKGASRFEDMLGKQILKLRGLEFGVFTGIFHGRPQAQSDILLVGKFTDNALNSFDAAVQKILGQELAFTVLTLEEFEYRKNIFDRYIKDVFENSHLVVAKKKPR
jgi:hypothetical protein